MVGFDTNAEESQYLQGWLMHDRFMLRAPLGAPYEFLWANPYLPGLTYEHAPPVFHDERRGTLFVRSGWDETAQWFGYFDGVAQRFSDGRVTAVNFRRAAAPIQFPTAAICFGAGERTFRVRLEAPAPVFVLGLDPDRVYQVEIEDEEMYEAPTDRGGILELRLQGGETALRVRGSAAPASQ